MNGYDVALHGQYFAWNWRYLPEYGARVWILILAGSGIVIGGVRRDRNTFILALGTLVLLALSYTYTIGITPLFSALIVVIWSYLPLGILGAYTLEALCSSITAKWSAGSIPSGYLLVPATMLLLAASMMGVLSVRDITLPENGFVREEDLLAMKWIRENTEQDALFHISTHFWTPLAAHGLDAGYWIPYLAGRQTTLPPQNYVSDGDTAFMELVIQRARALSQASTMESLYAALIEYHVTHVYIGQRPAYLQGEQFAELPSLFELKYHQGDVWIFEVRGSTG